LVSLPPSPFPPVPPLCTPSLEENCGVFFDIYSLLVLDFFFNFCFWFLVVGGGGGGGVVAGFSLSVF
jgi:hypothetical protein